MTELARRGRDGALDSLKAQGYTGEGAAASASTEFARWGGVACAAIYRKADDCAFWDDGQTTTYPRNEGSSFRLGLDSSMLC